MTQSFDGPPAGPPNAVPYVDYHIGQKRILTMHLSAGGLITANVPPIVSIDGRQYIVYWGTVPFEIPADRPCHISVHVEGEVVGRAASLLLPPGPSTTRTYTAGGMLGHATLSE
ncbi:hypothetical protein ACFOY2_43785 [Nonomuraea purpurea]|uniref:Uncharacterized protein n=1 Tax=Nonomuraea purpurea TaxID=1849276 RepID=A0ABV8GJT2_9ACTN